LDINNIAIDQIEASAQATKKVGVLFNEMGEPTVGFVIVSKDSPEYRDAAAKMRANAIRRQTNRKTKIDRTTEDGAIKLDEILQENEFALATSVVKGWFGFTEPDGNGGQRQAEFSSERAEHILKVKPTWREKITFALEDEEGFLIR
jgi:hypothetical protein